MGQYEKHKNAIEIFRKMISTPRNYLLIHYSCESFVDKEDGRTPRITTIAIRYFESSQTKTFSIHEVAEQNHIDMDKIEENYDKLEREMLSPPNVLSLNVLRYFLASVFRRDEAGAHAW